MNKMYALLFSCAPEILISVAAWKALSLEGAILVTFFCAFVSYNVYDALMHE